MSESIKIKSICSVSDLQISKFSSTITKYQINQEHFRTSIIIVRNYQIKINHSEVIFVRKYQNQINLERFGTSNFEIFFNHSEIMIIRTYQNQIILERFRISNFKILFNHGKGILATPVPFLNTHFFL